MNSEGCWSTVVCRPEERAALGLSGGSEWLLQCRLGIGHQGNHATDASPYPRHDRRLWLEWNDFDNRAQSLIERNPCPVISPEGAPCVFFTGHGGPHFYVRSNGHAPSVVGAAPGGRPPHPHGRHGAETESVPEPPRFDPNLPDPNAAGPDLPGPNVPGPYGPGPSVPPRSVPPMPDPLRRGGAHHLPEGHVPSVPDAPDSGAMPPGPMPGQPVAEDSGYRGGRRSTNAEPPSNAFDPSVSFSSAGNPAPMGPGVENPYAGSRHRADSAEIPLAGVAGPMVDEDRDAAISAALDDVAAALARLSALLRRD